MYFDEDNFSKDITIALAHEVKNPVALIKANIELLEFDKVLENHKTNVKTIKNELNKISDIISDFMIYCNQFYEEKPEKVNLFYIIKEQIEKLNVYNNITFSINCFENIEDMFVFGEDFKISLALSNIYKNCIEAIEGNQGFIQTNLYTKDNTIVLDIIDNGKGIEEEILPKISKPFFTIKKNGSGLGIPICIKAMKSMGGSFEIFNNKNKGCTTRLTFNNKI